MTAAERSPYRENGFRRLLGVRVADAEPGRAVVEVPVGADLRQAAGNVHGGVFASLIDSAAADALRGLLRDGQSSATIDLNVSFLRPATDGMLAAEASVLFHGRSIAICTVDVSEVVNGRRTACAVGRATFKISRVRQAAPAFSPHDPRSGPR